MRFRQKFLIKSIYLFSISVIVLSCSSVKNTMNDDMKTIDFNYINENMNLNNNNKICNKKILLEIKNLQAINIIYFSLDRYFIMSDFFSALDMHANFLCTYPFYRIRIEGHADERGTPEYNIALGERRAFSVKSYLQSKGVLSNQLETISYGKEKPICLGHTESAYSKNRRVVLSY